MISRLSEIRPNSGDGAEDNSDSVWTGSSTRGRAHHGGCRLQVAGGKCTVRLRKPNLALADTIHS